jgi:hypothetical protein
MRYPKLVVNPRATPKPTYMLRGSPNVSRKPVDQAAKARGNHISAILQQILHNSWPSEQTRGDTAICFIDALNLCLILPRGVVSGCSGGHFVGFVVNVAMQKLLL